MAAPFVIMVIRLHVMIMFFKCTDCQVLSTCLLPIYHQECDLNCTTADQSKPISFYKLPDVLNPIAQCLGSNCMVINASLTTMYSIQSTDSTTTTFRINNLSWDEKGNWRCEYNSTQDTTDLGFAKYPDDIEYSGLSNNSDIESGTVMPITMKCLYTEIPTLVTLIYQSTGGTARSIPVTCTDTTSSCANNNFVSKLCRPIIQVETGVVCDGNYSIAIATSVLGNEERKYSVLTGITIKCKVSKEVDDKTYDFIQYDGYAKLGASGGSGGGCVQVLIHGTLTITAKTAGLLFFSNQYLIGGTVVYGIQIVFVSTVINAITIIIGVVLLAIYFGQVQCIAILYFILLAAAASMLSVLIFMAIVYLFGHKDFIHIKFKNRKKSKNMSSLGLKLTKNDTINFSFKVKAINACMTLHVLENGETESISKSRKVKMVLGDGFPIRPVPENRVQNFRDSLICNIVSHTEYTSFCLNTESKHITLLNEQGGIILQWTSSAESFTVKDIEISNINQDDSTKDSSTEKEKEEKLDTPDEWIFWFRKGDTLCEFGEHEREIKEGLRCKQTVQLICVVIFPIAWLVMIVLMVKYLFKSKGKKADDNESEMSEQLNQKQKESSEQQNKKQKG